MGLSCKCSLKPIHWYVQFTNQTWQWAFSEVRWFSQKSWFRRLPPWHTGSLRWWPPRWPRTQEPHFHGLFFLYIIFLGKIGIRCWIWTNKGLKVEFYVEFDIDVIIYIYVYIYMYIYIHVWLWYIYIYIHMEAERIWQISSRRVLTVSIGMDPVSQTGRSRSTTAVWHHIFAACFYIHCKDRYIFAMDCNIYINMYMQ